MAIPKPRAEAIELQDNATHADGQSSNFGPDQEPIITKTPYLKLFSSAFTFFVAGVNDGSLGALVPYLMRSYHIETSFVSILYVSDRIHFILQDPNILV